MSRRTANGIWIPVSLTPALPALAIPDKRRGFAVPGLGYLLEPCADLSGSSWLLSFERARLKMR
jgi:hypothetical protein